MKAIHYTKYGGPEVLEYVDLADPVPAPHEALISVRCASVIPGDWKVRSGHLREMFPIDLPTIPGRDGAGVVIATGDNCDWANVGDELCFVSEHVEQGSYAELIARPREMTIPKPPNVNFGEAAAMMHAGVCAWIGLIESTRISKGQNVLIHAGAGAIGGMAIQIASSVGCNVTTTCSAANSDYVRELGARHVVPYDREEFCDQVKKQDIVFDLIGGIVHQNSCKVLRPGGTLVWLIAEPFDDVSSEYDIHCKQAIIHDRRDTMERLSEQVTAGILKPQVSRLLPLTLAAEAHKIVEGGSNTRGRVILEIGDGA
ncbi:MAG: NADP-dependent oxidoreductase [Pseudomonadota bacterium]|nr:NADP-dependent oxidoreductase [Pseudomonadota bacterium]